MKQYIRSHQCPSEKPKIQELILVLTSCNLLFYILFYIVAFCIFLSHNSQLEKH